MGLWRGIIAVFTYNTKDVLGPVDVAERLTGRGRRTRPAKETAGLGERDTVAGWLTELPRASDQQVFVHRSWGTVVAVADGKHPVSVFRSDGDTTWHAVPPAAVEDADLTPEQMKYVMLEALTSPGPPAWPQWRVLI